MISLCTTIFSLDGQFLIKYTEQSDLDTIERRATKYLTTDGGSEFFDGGWSNADRTLQIKTRNVVEALRLQEMGKIYQKWTASWRGQFAVVHFQRVSIAGGEATIELLGDH